jgi:hypothetical protein
MMHLTQENTGQQQLKCGLGLAMEMTAGLTVEYCQQIVKYRAPVGDMNQTQIHRCKTLTHQVET